MNAGPLGSGSGVFLQLLTIALPILACLQLAHAVGHPRRILFVSSAAVWLIASVLTAGLFPSITYYNHGPMVAAGLSTLPFPTAAALAVAATFVCSFLGLSRKYYLAPTVVAVLVVAHSASWIR